MPGPQDRRAGVEVATRAQTRLRVVGEDGAAESRRPIVVLYVEDDADDVFLLRRQLQSLPNFDVEFFHASTVVEARALAATRRFDVVLCDFWLGSETTISLIDDLRLQLLPCPVVLVSSLENEDIELIGRRAGAAGFVAKADLSAAALDRIFATLLKAGTTETRTGGAVAWLRALMRSIDAVRAAGRRAPKGAEPTPVTALISDIADAGPLGGALVETLAGLELESRRGACPASRFDAVPYIADGVERLRRRFGDEQVHFLEPETPVIVEASTALFGDLVQGAFAEAADLRARRVDVALSLAGGTLTIDILAMPRRPGDGDGADAEAARAEAAARARRLIVESLSASAGGTFEVVAAARGATAARLRVPLRPAT